MTGRGFWKDLYTTLHWPRAMAYLCWLLVGSALAPTTHLDRLLLSLLAAHLYLQHGAYALDELKGRHCGTALSARFLKARAAGGIAGAIVIGLYLSWSISWTLLPLALVGMVLVWSYNLEVLGALHSRVAFGLMWGAYPILTHYYLQSLAMPPLFIWVLAAGAVVWSFGHIMHYGNYFCGVETCVEYRAAGEKCERLCHGQICRIRRTMPRAVHRLQKTITSLDGWALIIFTAALVAWRLTTW